MSSSTRAASSSTISNKLGRNCSKARRKNYSGRRITTISGSHARSTWIVVAWFLLITSLRLRLSSRRKKYPNLALKRNSRSCIHRLSITLRGLRKGRRSRSHMRRRRRSRRFIGMSISRIQRHISRKVQTLTKCRANIR